MRGEQGFAGNEPWTKTRRMTDDVKPEYETPSPDSSPVDGEGEEQVYPGETSYLPERDVAAEAGDDLANESEGHSPEPSAATAGGVSFWTRLRRAIVGAPHRMDDPAFAERIRQLDQAIENAPDTPANYVLRGELYLDAGEYHLAQADFQRGYELAAQQFERSDWGLIAQAMQDRALAGLEKAAKKIKAVHKPAFANNNDDQTNPQS